MAKKKTSKSKKPSKKSSTGPTPAEDRKWWNERKATRKKNR